MMREGDLTGIVNRRPSIDNAVGLPPVVLVDGWEVEVVDELVLDAVWELGGDDQPRLGVDSVSGELLVSGRRDSLRYLWRVQLLLKL